MRCGLGNENELQSQYATFALDNKRVDLHNAVMQWYEMLNTWVSFWYRNIEPRVTLRSFTDRVHSNVQGVCLRAMCVMPYSWWKRRLKDNADLIHCLIKSSCSATTNCIVRIPNCPTFDASRVRATNSLNVHNISLITLNSSLMNTSKFTASFVALALVFCLTLATPEANESRHAIPPPPPPPPLPHTHPKFVGGIVFHPCRCYTRTQFCCYKYYPCGVYCRCKRCYKVRKCVRRSPYTHRCCKYVIVRVCVKRCYTKLCRRFRCTSFSLIKRPVYRTPKMYKLGKRLADKKVEA